MHLVVHGWIKGSLLELIAWSIDAWRRGAPLPRFLSRRICWQWWAYHCGEDVKTLRAQGYELQPCRCSGGHLPNCPRWRMTLHGQDVPMSSFARYR